MLPEVLIVHLLRFGMAFGMGQRRGAVRKNTAKVSVPEVLDVKPWVVDGLERTRYRLSSMLYHTGGLNSGHYVARVKSGVGVDLMDDESKPQRMKGWNDAAGSFTPYVLVFQRE